MEEKKDWLTARAVQRWRKESWYEIHFWSEVRSVKAGARDKKNAQAKALKRVVFRSLTDWAVENWPEQRYVISQFNGRRYDTPEAYAQHLRADGLLPLDWLGREGPENSI